MVAAVKQEWTRAKYHDVRLVAEGAVLFALDDEQHAIEEEDVARRLGTVHAERSLGDELAVSGQVLAGPAVEQALHLLDAHGVLVLALHVVDVVRDARHGRQRHDDVRVAGRLRAVAVLHDVLQQQVVLQDALHRLEQVRAERQRVLQLRLPFPARSARRLVPHQLRQHRHFPISP